MLDGRWRTSIEKGLQTGRRQAPPDRDLGRRAHRCRRGHGRGAPQSPSPPDISRSGLLFLVLTGLPDALDGAVAKAAGTAGPRGSFFDSVADRVSDTLLLGGVAWYLATTQPGLMPLLPMAVLGASLIISYERAKAESLGFNAKGGVMERAERIIALGLGLLFEVLLVPVLVADAGAHRAHRRAAVREGVAPGLARSGRPCITARRRLAGAGPPAPPRTAWRQNLQARRRR